MHKSKKSLYSPQTSWLLEAGQRLRFWAALLAQHMSCIHSSLTLHILHTSYSTTLIFPFIIFTDTHIIMPYTLVQLSFLTKKATRFTICPSSLKPANFNLHFWTHWGQKITHIWRFIQFVLPHIDITLKISIGPMEITLSPRPYNGQAFDEENVWVPVHQKQGGDGEYWLWGDHFPKYIELYPFLPPISTFDNGVSLSMYIKI
jgi:hypothetical protein